LAKSSLILQIFVDIKPTSERKQSPSDGTRHGGDNCWPTAVGGEMLSIVNGNLWGGFIADLSYVNFVPLGDFLDADQHRLFKYPQEYRQNRQAVHNLHTTNL